MSIPEKEVEAEESNRCLFSEPWIGRCKGLVVPGKLCCEEHAKLTCQVCGRQALTRCQASIGVMCGVPLCHACGQDEMCLEHATQGPVYVIATLLGRGPVPSVFARVEDYVQEARRMKELKAQLLERGAHPSMEAFETRLQKYRTQKEKELHLDP